MKNPQMNVRVVYILSALLLLLTGCGSTLPHTDSASNLLTAAQSEGALTVYGSCEEDYLSAACKRFETLYGIPVKFSRLSTAEIEALIESENGVPSADVWFGGTSEPYDILAADGFLEAYGAENASRLLDNRYRDPDGYWYGIYRGTLGFIVNQEELERRGLDAPADWPDLLDPRYEGLIWTSDYTTSGTAQLLVRTILQKYGHNEGIRYLCDLDRNIAVYTRSGPTPSKQVGPGDCVIAIGFLHDGLTQIVDNGYENIKLIIPASGTACEIGATAIFRGAAHPNAAKLWIEFALSPECVELAAKHGSYQFLVIQDAVQPKQAYEFGLEPEKLVEFDIRESASTINDDVKEVMSALGGKDSRFETLQSTDNNA